MGTLTTTRPRRLWRRVLWLLFALTLTTSAVVAVQPLWLFDLLARVFPHIVWRVQTTAPVVGLSFDDGPAPDHTPQVLDILARHHARATFFLIGDRAAAHPDFLERLRGAGHEIGNHYYTIRSTMKVSDDEFLSNLLRTERVLGLRGPLKLFRPPGGLIRASQSALAEAQGYHIVLGSAYPYDPSHPPSSYIEWLIAKNLAPGVIVILHDGIADPSRMIDALDAVLAAGERKGLKFVPVGDLLETAAPR